MVDSYLAVGLVPIIHGVRRGEEIARNLEHVVRLAESFFAVAPTHRRTRLLTIPEGALQGFADEQLDLDHEEYARECAIEVPGRETDALADLARKHDVFVMASAKARHPEFPRRFFNTAFLLSPAGDLIHRSYKLNPIRPNETSVAPHDVWDRWTALYGDGADAFFPVADTPIGRLGFMIGNDGSYPENARALALRGCEIALRGPFAQVADAEVQNRARALDNNMYVIANQVGVYHLDGVARRATRTSMIVDPQGAVVTSAVHTDGPTWIVATIDLEALRTLRTSDGAASWLKNLRTEQWRSTYAEAILPANMCAHRPPLQREAYRTEVSRETIASLVRRGIVVPPDGKESE